MLLDCIDTILYNNENYAEMREGKINKLRNGKLFGHFQFHYLIPYLTAMENVLLYFFNRMLPVNRKNAEYAKECLDKVGLEGKYERLYNQLSGGEQQRVAFDRALVKNREYCLPMKLRAAWMMQTAPG